MTQPPSVCAWCGSVEWREMQSGAFVCTTCDLTPTQAGALAVEAHKTEAVKRETQAKSAVRQQELDRRSRMVIEASKGQPMPQRIAVARYLLLGCLGLNAEAWNEQFRAWQNAQHSVRRAS